MTRKTNSTQTKHINFQIDDARGDLLMAIEDCRNDEITDTVRHLADAKRKIAEIETQLGAA